VNELKISPGTKGGRPGLREALAACRSDDMLVVTKLDRLPRSLPDGRDIVDAAPVKALHPLTASIADAVDAVGREAARLGPADSGSGQP